MKKYSAPKLLRIAASGEHMPSCPHLGSKIPGRDCKCWQNEVRKWDERVKAASVNRVRKPKALKSHLIKDTNGGVYCGKKNPQSTVMAITPDTCSHCVKRFNAPPKKKRHKTIHQCLVVQP